MADRVRPYLFYDVAVSICSTCYRKVEGKIVFQDGAVYMLKRCPAHGHERVLLAVGATVTRSGPDVTATDAWWNATIKPGRSAALPPRWSSMLPHAMSLSPM